MRHSLCDTVSNVQIAVYTPAFMNCELCNQHPVT